MKLIFSEIVIYQCIVIAAIIFLFFRILKIAVPLFIKKNSLKQSLHKYLPVFEFLIWIIFLIKTFKEFLEKNQYFAIFIFLVGVFVSFWASKLFLKEYISGIIFKTDKSYKTGDNISFDNFEGQIKKLKLRGLELESDKGDTVIIPYSNLLNTVISKKKISKDFVNYGFKINVSKERDIKKIFNKINEAVLTSPGVLLKNKPNIKIISEDDKNYELEVQVFILENVYAFNIEKLVKELILK